MKRSQNASTSFEVLPDWMTVGEARRFLRLSRTTMYERLRSGEIAARRFGRQYRISKEALRPSSSDFKGAA